MLLVGKKKRYDSITNGPWRPCRGAGSPLKQRLANYSPQASMIVILCHFSSDCLICFRVVPSRSLAMNISGRAVGGLRRKWGICSLTEWESEQTRETHDY